LNKAVAIYALELLEKFIRNNSHDFCKFIENNELYKLELSEENLLDGFKCWSYYSNFGGSLLYSDDIARRTCSPSEFKKTNN